MREDSSTQQHSQQHSLRTAILHSISPRQDSAYTVPSNTVPSSTSYGDCFLFPSRNPHRSYPSPLLIKLPPPLLRIQISIPINPLIRSHIIFHLISHKKDGGILPLIRPLHQHIPRHERRQHIQYLSTRPPYGPRHSALVPKVACSRELIAGELIRDLAALLGEVCRSVRQVGPWGGRDEVCVPLWPQQ